MNIKKFIAKNAQEAIKLVKQEMGEEAVILKTRTLPPSGNGIERSKRRIEVTAAIDYDAPVVKQSDSISGQKTLLKVERELREIRNALLCADAESILNPEFLFNRELRDRYKNFKIFGLKPEIIRALMDESQKPPQEKPKTSSRLLQESLFQVLTNIKVDEKSNIRERKIYSFIGPTGVGKTTTLAKLAALSAIQRGFKSALITFDTFRIAAAAQLETYARIMGLPLEIAVSSNDLQRAIRKHHDCDRIFIDTAGRSPNKDEDITELRKFFKIQEEIHPFLVLSATTQYQDMINIEKRFSSLSFKSYIFTKLDETNDVSTMINFLISRQKPISYLTTGQQVPEDIEIASRKKLAAFLLAGMRETSYNSISMEKKDGSSCRP